jgi:hypothetical protein
MGKTRENSETQYLFNLRRELRVVYRLLRVWSLSIHCGQSENKVSLFSRFALWPHLRPGAAPYARHRPVGKEKGVR